MKPDRDLDQLRTAYADLLDPEDETELVRFLGDLEALHTASPPPAPVRLAPPQQVRNLPTEPYPRLDTAPLRQVAQTSRGPRPMFPARWWGGAARATAAVAATLLVFGVLAASVALLGRGSRPATGSTPATPATLLYPGALDGQAGIVALAADGGERLLAAGNYFGVATSPDGRTFLAYGAIGDVANVALYAADGQFLQRYTLGAAIPLIAYWSPDAGHIALFARSPADTTEFHTWLLDRQTARELQLGGQTTVGTPNGSGVWSAQGRLPLSVYSADTNGDGQVNAEDEQAIWTVDAAGGDARQIYAGPGINIGWSRTGGELYVFESARLLAIDERSGRRRTVADASTIGQRVPVAPDANGATPLLRAFGAVAAAAFAAGPAGDRFALWFTPAMAIGATDPPALYLVAIDGTGNVIGQDQPVRTTPRFAAWSPDGHHLAYAYTAADGASGIRIVPFGAGAQAKPATFVGIDATMAEGSSLRWSPDGRELAFWRGGRITVATGPDLAQERRTRGTSTGWPAWLPPGTP